MKIMKTGGGHPANATIVLQLELEVRSFTLGSPSIQSISTSSTAKGFFFVISQKVHLIICCKLVSLNAAADMPSAEMYCQNNIFHMGRNQEF